VPRIGAVLVVALAFVPLGSAASPALELESCKLGGGIAARCGTFRVAEGRERPDGRAIDLRVAVLPAGGDAQPDPLVYLAGGPGGSAGESAPFVVSDIQETRARGALPLQLLAYRIARRRGLNVDQPRKLAKTVTVE
jgi:hypothetical protein